MQLKPYLLITPSPGGVPRLLDPNSYLGDLRALLQEWQEQDDVWHAWLHDDTSDYKTEPPWLSFDHFLQHHGVQSLPYKEHTLASYLEDPDAG